MKNCGNCRFYYSEDGVCVWESLTNIPFWAYIDNGDHREYVSENDGKRCPAWERARESKIFE